MKLRSGRILEEFDYSHKCGHTCELVNKLCCWCLDRRKDSIYEWFSCDENGYIKILECSRKKYYCPTCSKKSNHKKK